MEIHTQISDLLNLWWCDTDTYLAQDAVLNYHAFFNSMYQTEEFRFLIYQLVSEMKSEIKHAEMLTITVMKEFNSHKRPFALFETKTLIILHLQEEREISALLIEIVAMRDWRKQLKCVCGRGQGKFCSSRTTYCSTAPHLGASSSAQNSSSHCHTGSSAPQLTLEPQSRGVTRRPIWGQRVATGGQSR